MAEAGVRTVALLLNNGTIDSVKPATSIHFRSGDVVHVYPSATLSPGFIDALIHGADGYDVMDGTVESLHGIARRLLDEGTTAFLPSSMTASEVDTKKAARAIYDSMRSQTFNQAKILGSHGEGPYFSIEKIGCHDLECRRDPDIREVIKWQSASGHALKVITVAPELDGAIPFIRWASENGIVVSIGHTMATCEQTQAAIDAGATMATHLFNAMNMVLIKERDARQPLKPIPKEFFSLLLLMVCISTQSIFWIWLPGWILLPGQFW